MIINEWCFPPPLPPFQRGKDYKLLFILTLTHTKHLIFLSLISKNTFQFQRIEMCFSFIACLLPLDPPPKGEDCCDYRQFAAADVSSQAGHFQTRKMAIFAQN
jgi:hypothetical protein